MTEILNYQLENLRHYYLAIIDTAFTEKCNRIEITADTQWSPRVIRHKGDNDFQNIKIHTILKEYGTLKMHFTSIIGSGKYNRPLSLLHIESLHQLTLWLIRNGFIKDELAGYALEYKIETVDHKEKTCTSGPRYYRNPNDAWNYLRHSLDQTEGMLFVKVETGIHNTTHPETYGKAEYWLPIHYGNTNEEWIKQENHTQKKNSHPE